MFWRLTLSVSVLASLVAAGCVSPASVGDIGTASTQDLLSIVLQEPIFVDHQNEAHPAFGWPTLNQPPALDAGMPDFWQPFEARELPVPLAGLDLVAEAGDQIASGAGIALFGSIAVVPGFSDLSYVVDISNPEAPTVLSELAAEGGSHRGAVIIAYPDGRLVTAMSTGYGFDVWDITTPAEPAHLGQVETPNGGHKIGVVPGTPIIYNAHSGGGSSVEQMAAATSEIYDLTDPAEPVLVQEFANGFGCHHIYFWNDAAGEKYRATCAGIEYTQIWDTSDPLNPEVIVNIPVHHGVAGTPSASIPIVAFSHFAILNDDGNVLVVGDEMGGGGIPPGCGAGAQTGIADPSTPAGALWFYDVSDETNPLLLGWFSPGWHMEPDNAFASCTAHHGRLVPQEDGSNVLAMSFYGAGVVLLDFTNPTLPVMIDQYKGGANVWETWYYNGYLFTGDLQRGMDVLTFS